MTLAGGPLLRADRLGRCSSTVACPDGPGESSTRVRVGTIAARARAARPRRRRRRVPRRPRRAIGDRRPDADAARPSAARRPSSTALVGQARHAASAGWASSSTSTSIATGSSSTRCSPAGSSWRCARREGARRGRRSSCAFGAADGRAAHGRGAHGRPGADWLPADDAPVIVRYRDPTQMGKVYLLPAGVDRPVPGPRAGRDGPGRPRPGADARGLARPDPASHPGELKNLLRNQAFVAGIGNAYSDEILHAARLQPFRKRSSLAPEEVDELYAAMRSTLEASVQLLRAARAADVREAGPRPPRGPQPGRRGVPALRGADHRRSRPAGSRPRTAGAASAERSPSAYRVRDAG